MVGEGGGVHSHFHVQPNNSVEVVLLLCCVVVGVVTTLKGNFILALLMCTQNTK